MQDRLCCVCVCVAAGACFGGCRGVGVVVVSVVRGGYKSIHEHSRKKLSLRAPMWGAQRLQPSVAARGVGFGKAGGPKPPQPPPKRKVVRGQQKSRPLPRDRDTAVVGGEARWVCVGGHA